MTKLEFSIDLEFKGFTPSFWDTTDDCGVGGSFGTLYTNDANNVKVIVSTECYEHAPSESRIIVENSLGQCLINCQQTPSNFDAVLLRITEHLNS